MPVQKHYTNNVAASINTVQEPILSRAVEGRLQCLQLALCWCNPFAHRDGRSLAEIGHNDEKWGRVGRHPNPLAQQAGYSLSEKRAAAPPDSAAPGVGSDRAVPLPEGWGGEREKEADWPSYIISSSPPEMTPELLSFPAAAQGKEMAAAVMAPTRC